MTKIYFINYFFHGNYNYYFFIYLLLSFIVPSDPQSPLLTKPSKKHSDSSSIPIACSYLDHHYAWMAQEECLAQDILSIRSYPLDILSALSQEYSATIFLNYLYYFSYCIHICCSFNYSILFLALYPFRSWARDVIRYINYFNTLKILILFSYFIVNLSIIQSFYLHSQLHLMPLLELVQVINKDVTKL